MGYMRHHAILITCYDHEGLAHRFWKMIEEMAPGRVTAPMPSRVNGYASFAVLPDGSKEGWSDSDQGDQERDAIVAFLRADPLGAWPEWVEVQYGDDDGVTKVCRHSDDEDEPDDE